MYIILKENTTTVGSLGTRLSASKSNNSESHFVTLFTRHKPSDGTVYKSIEMQSANNAQEV